MNELNEMQQFAKLQRLIGIFQRISQISWSFNQTKRKFFDNNTPTPKQVDLMIQVFVALGLDLEDITNEWKKEYKDYKENEK